MLRPEVAARFELTGRSTRVHVVALGREFDLTRISLEQAEQLVSLPGGFDRLRRREVPAEVPVNDVGPAAQTAGPTKGKKKKGA